jgi:hypothetical protein
MMRSRDVSPMHREQGGGGGDIGASQQSENSDSFITTGRKMVVLKCIGICPSYSPQHGTKADKRKCSSHGKQAVPPVELEFK